MSRQPTVTLTVDWFSVVAELKRHGYSTYTLAAMVGVSRPSIAHWVNYGTIPNHTDGERVIAFWMDTTGKDRGSLPMKPRELSAAKVRN
jgi:hypothetical protein